MMNQIYSFYIQILGMGNQVNRTTHSQFPITHQREMLDEELKTSTSI
jgi:hypothetical protein